MTHIIRYGNGQCLSYSEFGTPNGFPILLQPGLITTIHDFRYFPDLVAAGTHLIAISRPGYGDSSPYVMQNFAEWGSIVAVLVEELGLTQFDVFGSSSGAPYSYAIGYRLADKVRNIFIFNGMPALYDEQIQAVWPYPIDNNASLDELETLAHELFFSNLSAEELQQPAIKESMANHAFGVALDMKLRCQDWGFRLSEIHTPVYMQHSRGDQHIPFIAAEMTARLLPNCRFEVVESDEHFSDALFEAFIEKTMIGHYK